MNKKKMNTLGPTLKMTTALMAISLSSCMLGPDYQEHEMHVPAAFRTTPISENSIADMPWWKIVKDDCLHSLLTDTYSNNHELKQMINNVDSARQYVTGVSAPLFPWVGYDGGMSRGASSATGKPMSSASTGASVSWELDIWGKTRRSIESAEADYMSSYDQMRALQLSLLRQVSTGYLQLLMLDEQLRITRNSVKSYQQSLDLFTAQLEGGVGNKLQVESARAALAAAQAQVPSLEVEAIALENSIGVLAGRMPGHIKRMSVLRAYAASSKVPAGVPASVLAQRPDVLAAQSQIRSANAKVGVAITNYFPSVSLTSSFGGATNNFGSSSRLLKDWGMGAALTGPLFQAGRLNAAKKIAYNDLSSAIMNYENTVLNAMAEVSTTLAQRDKLRQIMERQEAAVIAYRVSLETAMELYKHGVSNYYEVLTAQQNLFPAENLLAQYRYQYAATIPTLYTQLGGGWRNSNAEIAAGHAIAAPAAKR